MSMLLQRVLFRLEERVFSLIASPWRKTWWRLRGMQIGTDTKCPRTKMNWPHQVALGDRVILQEDVSFFYDSYWKPGPSIRIGDDSFVGRGCEFNVRASVRVGRRCLIAAGCKFIDQNHQFASRAMIADQARTEAPIVIEEGAWLGANVVVLAGVTIGAGAVIGACALVNRSVPAGEIWAGVPARKIGSRQVSGKAEMEPGAAVVPNAAPAEIGVTTPVR
jgi:acetyltransferase-like isoleucine patch superfamily enzyme